MRSAIKKIRILIDISWTWVLRTLLDNDFDASNELPKLFNVMQAQIGTFKKRNLRKIAKKLRQDHMMSLRHGGTVYQMLKWKLNLLLIKQESIQMDWL